ncbi:MAG TPA: permease-like cell division protein FtsX [Candidatus Dojkabacteria bacterium]|nr:permease-like cell division protein FtsX [Candidatus Dojkabacteria bacterium]
MTKNKLVETTKKNIQRNKFLSLSTIFVSAIVLLISSFFISIGILSQKAVKYYEKKAQVIVFFKRDTKEADIMKIKELFNDPLLVENIDYISQEKALAIYKEDFSDNPDLLATVTADSLPPSLEIRAKDVDSLLLLIEKINKEKETNSSIDEVMYFKDVVNNLKSLSSTIRIASIILISALVIIAFSLIRITVGFNINNHKDEIKIMNLMGSSSRYIRMPYILEGAYYGGLGGFIAATLIIVPFYIIILSLSKNPDFSFSFNQILRDLDVIFLRPVNIPFLLSYYGIHMLSGIIIGTISSMSAIKKYLK